MRKIFNLLLITFMFGFIGIISVEAASSTIDKTTFTWNGVDDFGVSKLSCTNARIDSGDITSGNVLKSASGSVKFTPNNSNVTVTCSIYKSKELTGNDVDEPVTSQTITIGTTTTSTTTKTIEASTTTKPKEEAPKSNNANLKTLEVKTSDGETVELTPAFKPGVYEYSASVSGTVKTVLIDVTLEDPKATFYLSKNASEELVAGENNGLTVTVTAEDGTKRTYTINVKREAMTADATLRELTIDEVEDFELIEDKYTYTIKLAKKVKALSLSYVTNDEKAMVEIEGNENLKDGSKVRITVTAEDGTKKVYTLNISKEDNNKKTDISNVETEKNPLIIMGLSIIAFGLVGGIIYVIKK